MKSVFALLFAVPLALHAGSYCNKVMPFDPEYPPGLKGTYEMIGREPTTGKPYAGSVVIKPSIEGFHLLRTIGNRKTTGTAWIEYCGADKVPHMLIQYDPSPDILELFCSIGTDGDNYYRLSCRTKHAASDSTGKGLEALFQRH